MRARRATAAASLAAVAALALGALPVTQASAQPSASAPTVSVPQFVPAQLMCAGYNGYHTLNPATSVLAGKVRVGGRSAVTIARYGNLNWGTKPFPNDYSWRVWLHTLKWTGDLIQVGQGKGAQSVYGPIRDTALRRAATIAVDYLRDRPVGRTAEPALEKSSMAGRVQVLACLIEAYRQRGWSVPSALMNGALASASRLAAYRRTAYDNKALESDLAIFTIGCTLGNAGSAMTDLGGRRITAGLAKAINVNGATNEQAPSYGMYAYKLFSTTADRMRLCGVAPPAALTTRLQAAATFLSMATQPDGTFAELGDTADGNGPKNMIPATLAKGTPLDWVRSGGTTGTPPAQKTAVYPAAGFAFGRSSWTDSKASFYSLRFGPARNLHGHFDHTSLTYAAGGRSVLVEAGHSGYNNASLRLAQRMPTGHNVVVDQTAKAGNLRQIDRAYLRATASGPGWESYRVADMPYVTRSRPGAKAMGIKRMRSVVVVHQGSGRPNVMLVFDTINSKVTRNFAQLWRVPAVSQISVLARGKIRARTTLGDTLIQRKPLPGRWLSRNHSVGVLSGIRSKALGSSTAAPIVKFPELARSTAFLTAIVPTAVGDAPVVSSTRNSDGRIEVTVTTRVGTVKLTMGSDALFRIG